MEQKKPLLAISKQDVSVLPPVTFSGDIIVVDSMDKARMAMRDLNRRRIVGFDTETRPSFRKGTVNKVALMQISTIDHCYLFRLNKTGIFDSLVAFLENPRITKIGLSVHDDFNVLRRSAPVNPAGFVELQSYVKQFSISDISLQKIYAIVFGQRISKSQRLTNWEAAELSPGQQTYAAIDAWACLRLYRHLRDGRFNPDKSPYKAMPDADGHITPMVLTEAANN